MCIGLFKTNIIWESGTIFFLGWFALRSVSGYVGKKIAKMASYSLPGSGIYNYGTMFI